MVYLYDEDTGACVGIHPCTDRKVADAKAAKFHSQGYFVKIVDTADNTVVNTLG
jgi:hypothetical protein